MKYGPLPPSVVPVRASSPFFVFSLLLWLELHHAAHDGYIGDETFLVLSSALLPPSLAVGPILQRPFFPRC